MSLDKADFIHLHVHTQYSLLDGAIRLDPLLERAKEFGMDSVAITDHGTMFGSVEFYEKSLKAGIKPIIGCECYVAPRTINDKTSLDRQGLSHLVLLAENQEGYKNLCRLASIGQLQGFYYRPRIDKEILQKYSKGLIGLTACLHGEIPTLLKQNNTKKADNVAQFYNDLFGENNFFLEIQSNNIDIQEKVNQGLIDMSSRLSIPLVATNDCHYLDKEDASAHELLLCIQTQTTINDPNRFKFSTDQLYFKSPENMKAAFGNVPESIKNTIDIAEKCNIEFYFNTYHFPKYDANSELTADDIFEKKVQEGFQKRMSYLTNINPDIDRQLYLDRLEYETRTIKEMGFPGYFLIVADFIQYAKDNKIPVGPGRGSAAGSIVAHSMGITDLDPIEHGLIFERFLNPARKSMPDIDVDFCINGREQVFNYVVERYGGGDYVAQIITFGKLKTKAVIRDVGRALDIPLREVDAICKLVPDVLNIGLDEAIKQEPKLKELEEENPEIAELMKISRVLEGLPRHASTHAAGVVIGDKKLVEYLPLFKGKNDEVVTQFDMKRVEQIGLVKFDFLGLRNLTVIDKALHIIKEQGKSPPDLLNLDMNDDATFKLLGQGDTIGVFQLESSGMKDLLVKLKPENFGDVTALVALYRPGPMGSGMVDDFVERKHGRKSVEYTVPELEDILKETYGVILYQEQVMKIAASLAKYSMAEADDLRKAMGKKIAGVMARHRIRFMNGSGDNNIPADKAKTIFDQMEKFGGYGFNKSHSAAYALIAYQTAYLKAHYPIEFMAALLTSEMNSIDGIVKFIAECRSHSIEVLPPDINESKKEFTVNDSKIRFGLLAVKNVGEGAIDSILEIIKDGKFTSLYDFCERVNLRKVNKRVLESLIKCGAFDSLGHNRSEMMVVLEDALDFGQRIQKEKADPQMGLFDMTTGKDETLNYPPIPEIEEWDSNQLLTLEKESLGFYISGHPLDRYSEIIDKFTNVNTLSIADITKDSAVRIGGIIRGTKNHKTKKGDMMAFATIEDIHGGIEIVIFPSVYSEYNHLLLEDAPVLIQGKAQVEENSVKILADMIIPVEKAEETWTADIHLHFDTTKIEKEILYKLKDILKKHNGTSSVYIHIMIPGKSEIVIQLPETMNLKAGSALTDEINQLAGYKIVETTCKTVVIAPQPRKFRGKNNHYESTFA